MQTEDFNRFRAVMAGMAKLYERELDGPLMDAYWLALRDWALADFESAAAHLMANNQFMPRPADFTAIKKAARPTAGEAWLTARKSLKWTLHGYVLKDDVDPLIAKSIYVIGGPNTVAMCDEDKLHWLEKRFNEAYESLQDSNDTRASVPQIAAPKALKLPGLRA